MSYKTGIVKAIADLKDRTGSSMIAIKKHMQSSLPSDKKWANRVFLTALKSGVAAGDFVQVKASYKLSPNYKKKLADGLKPKKPKKKAAPKKKRSSVKKVAPKKKAAPKKKSAPKKKTTKKSAKKTTKKSAKKTTKKSSKKTNNK